jgi:formate hydrogenlyase subunit 3/multisubunit Na+/H+ antiporter MnhD subunit
MAPVGIYILLRASSVGPGVVVPVWWGLPLLAMGMASAVLGGWRAAREQALEAIVANLAMLPAGLAATGIGFTLVAAATDLPDLAALSLAAVFLLALTQALCITTLVLATGAVRLAAGARRLDQLGGLAHRMKLTTSAIAAALFCLVALPPASGFAALWLLVHAALTAPRAGSLLPQLLFVALIVGLALSSALATAAVVRLIGIAFLGRPRLPRSSAADEITRPARVVLLGLAALSLVVGILPGTVLNLLADPAITALSGNHLGARIGWLTLAPTLAAPGYAPLPLALLLAVAASGAVWIVRRQRREERDSPAWSGGFAAPPAWLPFGDPLTQGSGGGFVPDTPSFPLHRSMFRRPPRRLATTASGWTLLVVAVIALMSIAWLDTP